MKTQIKNIDNRFLRIPIDLVYPNPNQPRKRFDQDKMDELTAEVKANGQPSPGKVKPDEQGKYMIICGERRWRACKAAGLTFYEAEVCEMDYDRLMEEAFKENHHRADITPMEEANAFNERLQSGVYEDIKDLAKKLGIRPSFIEGRLNLLKLEPECQQALDRGVITVGYAAEVAKLSRGGQQRLLQLLTTGKITSLRQCKLAVERLQQVDNQTGLFQLEAPIDAEESKSLESSVSKLMKLIGKIEMPKNISAYLAQKLLHQIQEAQKRLKALHSELEKIAIRAAV